MKRTNRLIAWLLCLAMLLSGCSVTAGAEVSSADERDAFRGEIAESFLSSESLSEWVIFDLAANGSEIPADKRDAYKEAAIASISDESAMATDYAKAAIILSKLGEDITAEAIALPEKIAGVSEFMTYSDAIWLLISDCLDPISLSDEQKFAAVAKISESTNERGIIFGSYGGYTYDDPDSTGAAVGALFPLFDDADTYGAKALWEKMLSALSAAQLENGSYGSACTDAFVIIGLAASGIDADKDERFLKGENSLLDGLMSFKTEGGFAGWDGNLDIDWSTEQGFRALVAYAGFEENGEEFNVYYTASVTDDGGEDKEEGKEEGEDPPKEDKPSGSGGLVSGGDKTEPEEKPGEEVEKPENKNTITVTFEMKTHKKTWISFHTVEVEKNTTVKKLIEKVFDAYGVESKGLATGYLRSVTYKGETWGEFDAGAGSGWQYFVNGTLPQVGIGSFKLSDGDSVSLAYTADYTGGAGSSGSSSGSESTEDLVKDEEKAETKSEESEVEKFIDLEDHAWAADAINTLADEGIIKGTSENTFAPSANITRADFAVLLVRAFKLASDSEENFADVSASDYFAKELAVARNTGLVNGIGENKFAPRNNITRQDMMVIVCRALKSMDKLVGDGVLDVPQASDFDTVSDYAKEAVSALVNAGLVNGKNGNVAPLDYTTRAEVAVLIARILDFIKQTK